MSDNSGKSSFRALGKKASQVFQRAKTLPQTMSVGSSHDRPDKDRILALLMEQQHRGEEPYYKPYKWEPPQAMAGGHSPHSNRSRTFPSAGESSKMNEAESYFTASPSYQSAAQNSSEPSSTAFYSDQTTFGYVDMSHVPMPIPDQTDIRASSRTANVSEPISARRKRPPAPPRTSSAQASSSSQGMALPSGREPSRKPRSIASLESVATEFDMEPDAQSRALYQTEQTQRTRSGYDSGSSCSEISDADDQERRAAKLLGNPAQMARVAIMSQKPGELPLRSLGSPSSHGLRTSSYADATRGGLTGYSGSSSRIPTRPEETSDFDVDSADPGPSHTAAGQIGTGRSYPSEDYYRARLPRSRTEWKVEDRDGPACYDANEVGDIQRASFRN
ncbi:hypothetical protein IAR55_002075 [Kwoniella newhampshirensis]|uniref:Uncharacterized protein n=1 Tax=Kwoniella newhampshirensis TaxID=1651941 RepID=A0AAW0YYJ2_9TREE